MSPYSLNRHTRLIGRKEYTYFQTKEHQRTGSALVDVRESFELKEYGEVPGAIHIPVGYVDEAFAMDN